MGGECPPPPDPPLRSGEWVVSGWAPYLAEHVVFVDIFHPVVTAVLLVVVFLVSTALCVVHLGLEAIVLLH